MVASHVFNWLSTTIAKLGIAVYRFTNGIVRSDIDNSLDVSPMTCIQTKKNARFCKTTLTAKSFQNSASHPPCASSPQYILKIQTLDRPWGLRDAIFT